MLTQNNQIIIEDLYDEGISPSDEDVIEYAEYIGIDPINESELMWIARQGVKAPLPKCWKAVHDPGQNELYYFNFETGESIWDHPCDQDFKQLAKEERKILLEKGKDNYIPNKYRSPASTLKNSDKFNGTSKSTSSLSEVLNGRSNQNRNSLKNEFALFDTRDLGNVEFEEEDEHKLKRDKDEEDEDEESEPSWQRKSGSDDSSDDFRKPVDFGIDKETSIKLDKLNVKLMVGKEAANLNLNSVDSAPTTSRDLLDSPTRNYVRGVLGYSNNVNKEEDFDVRRSTSLLESNKKQLDSLIEEKSSEIKSLKSDAPKDTKRELKNLKESLDREFDQKRLELLESKELRVKKLKDEIEKDISRINELESKRLLNEQDERLKEFRERIEKDFRKEQEMLRKKNNESLNTLQREFESDKQLRKQKFSMQLSKFMKSGKSFDELDENEEKREIAIYFDHIEKKYADKLEDRRKELQNRYEKKLRDLEDELRKLHDEESEKKENDIRMLREKNLRIENYDKQMETLLADKIKEFKDKESQEMGRIKEEYEIKVKTFKDKFKQLEENEFNYLENEFNKAKERHQLDYNNKMSQLENKLKAERQRLEKQDEDLKKRQEVIQDRKREIEAAWTKLNEEETNLVEKKEAFINKIASNIQNTNPENDDLKVKYEIEKLRLEKSDLETKLAGMQKLLDKFYNSDKKLEKNKSKALISSDEELPDKDGDDSDFFDSEKLVAKINEINNKLSNKYDDEDEDDENDSERDLDDDNEIKELVKHAQLKLKLKYYNSKKQAQIDLSNKSACYSNETDLEDSDDQEDLFESNYIENEFKQRNPNELELTENKKDLLENLSKEKDALQIANELLDRYKHSLVKRRLKLDSAQSELKSEENMFDRLKSTNEKTKHQNVVEEKRLFLEKEELDLQQLALNIKTGKRLIKQKKSQINILESNIFGNLNQQISDDTSSSQDEQIENESTKKMNYIENFNDLISFKNTSNLNDFINKLKVSQSRGELSNLSIQKIQPILKKLPKLNNRLEVTFENIKSSTGPYNSADTRMNHKDSSFIDEKWKSYLNKPDINEKINFFQNITSNQSKNTILINTADTSKIQNGAWENTPTYQRLMLESGTRMLDEKWNQYIGFDSSSNFGNNQKMSKSFNLKKSNSNSSNFSQFSSTSPVVLPASTQNRLNQHREWIRRFKASDSHNV